MLINRRAWELEVTFSALEMQLLAEENAYIPASIFLGSMRHLLQSPEFEHDIFKDFFGSHLGLLKVTDLKLIPDVGQPHIRNHLHTAIDRFTGAADSKCLYERTIMHDSTFRGTVILKNGGVYPAVLAHHVISQALPNLQVGQGASRGLGRVQKCRMIRSDSSAESFLNPVEAIFRKTGHKIIEHIASHPELVYSLEWRDLERVIAQVFEEIGYSVKLTESSHDGGKDLVLYCLSGLERRQPKKYYVEIKHWRGGTFVGASPITKLVQVSARDGASGSVLLSTSGFCTRLSKELVSKRECYLGDLSAIHTLCRFYDASRRNELFSAQRLEDIVHLNLTQ